MQAFGVPISPLVCRLSLSLSLSLYDLPVEYVLAEIQELHTKIENKLAELTTKFISIFQWS
jgi:hypothetical protein